MGGEGQVSEGMSRLVSTVDIDTLIHLFLLAEYPK